MHPQDRRTLDRLHALEQGTELHQTQILALLELNAKALEAHEQQQARIDQLELVVQARIDQLELVVQHQHRRILDLKKALTDVE
jgi:hypothetical protein